MLPIRTIEQAKAIRNQSWQKCGLIPTWVNQEEVGLDCFYTHPDIAHECSENLYATMQKDAVNLKNYHFIQPSAGTGVFYNLMPENSRTGIDILPIKDFSEVRYGCGYGILIKKERNKIEHLLNNTDWCHYSNLAVHNCRHISMYHIRQALIDGGFVDA